MQTGRLGLLAPPVIAVVAVIVVWQVVVTALRVPLYVLPSPYAIFQALSSSSINWTSNSLTTLYETVGGFLLAVLIAVPLAMALTYWKWFNRTVYPIILALQVVPKAGLAPLVFLLFGFGFLPRVIVTLLLAFFPIVTDTAAGLNSLDPDHVDLMRSLGASKLQIFTTARFPNAMPYILTGLKVAITFALIGAVVAEFVQANEGLGYLLLIALSVGATSNAFAALAVLTFMGAALFVFFVAFERFAIKWYFRSKEARS